MRRTWPDTDLLRARLPGWRLSLVLVATWLLVAAPTAVTLFLTGSRTTVVAGHDAVVSPTLDGYATLDLGPYLPNFRYPSGGTVGAHIDLGKTTVDSYSALIERYAFIASRPEGQIRKVIATLTDLAVDSAVDGALVGLVAPAVVLLVGRRRWAELGRGVTVRRTTAGLAVVLVATTLASPALGPRRRARRAGHLAAARRRDPRRAGPRRGQAAADRVRPGHQRHPPAGRERDRLLPAQHPLLRRARGRWHRRWRSSCTSPAEGETVGAAGQRPARQHRHGRRRPGGRRPGRRDVPARRRGRHLDRRLVGGVQPGVAGPGVRTTTDDRVAVAGNHDNGDFVTTQARKLGFTTLDGKVVDGPAGMRLLGVADPRSSGLGTWRDERGISFEDQEQRLADVACAHDADGDRINTLLVHDANSGREALNEGCVDLVLGGAPARAGRADRGRPARTARPATPTPTARRAARRTPSPSAASSAATRR